MRGRVDRIPVFGRRIQGVPYIVRPSAYALVRDPAGALAIARTRRGWFLPGGGIESGETAEAAAARETTEECALIVKPHRLVGKALEIVYVPKRRACVAKDSVFFEAELAGPSNTVSEHELEWLPLEQALERLTDRSHRWAVNRL